MLHVIATQGVRLLMLLLADALTLIALTCFIAAGFWFLAVAFGIILVGLNLVVLVDRLYPLRWLGPGLALLILMVIAPIAYTVYVAFTNYSGKHLLTKQQALQVLGKETFLGSNAVTYQWRAFRSPSGQYALWLAAPDGRGLIALPGQPVRPATPGSQGVGALNQAGLPERIEGYERVSKVESVRSIDALAKLEFGQPPDVYRIASLSQAAQYEQKYVFDRATDTLTDREAGVTYRPIEGTFTSGDGPTISPSFQSTIGVEIFRRLFTNTAIRVPVAREQV